jgi:hypothetical protein
MGGLNTHLTDNGLGKEFIDYGKLFLRETSIFLHYDQGGIKANVPVTCQEASEKTNIVTMVWPDGKEASVVHPPPLNAKVTCITMLRGRLLQLPARISGLHKDKQLKLVLAMDKSSRIINLRKYPRYRVYGWVLMGEFTSYDSLAQRQEMDISLGGFGASIIEWEWAVGSDYPFKLTAQVFASEERNKSTPSLMFDGSAVVRRFEPSTAPQQLQVGAEFAEIDPSNHEQLRLWLVENRALLREV